MIKIRDYTLDKCICENEFVTVYLATHNKIKKICAVNVLSERYIVSQRLITSLISPKESDHVIHPHFATIIDIGEVDKQYYFVTPFFSDNTLQTIMQRPISVAFALDVTTQIASVLHYLSMKGFIHGNIRPEQIIIDSDASAILNGISILPKMGLLPNQIESHYASPERIAGKKNDHQSDLYSLGIILYEMLTGIKFETVTSIVETPASNVNELGPYLPEHLFVFQPVINKLLAKNPRQRFQNALELIDAISDCEFKFDSVDLDNVLPENIIKTGQEQAPKIEKSEKTGSDEFSFDEIAKTGSASLTNNSISNKSSYTSQAKVADRELLHYFELEIKQAKNIFDHEALVKVFKRNQPASVYLTALSFFVIVAVVFIVFIPATVPVDEIASVNHLSLPTNIDSNVKAVENGLKNSLNADFDDIVMSTLTSAANRRAVLTEQSVAAKPEQDLIALKAVALFKSAPVISTFDLNVIRMSVDVTLEKIHALFNDAENFISTQKFTTPTDGNAFGAFLQILKLDPGNRRALQGIENLAEGYAYMAKRQLEQGNFELAKRYVVKGLKVDDENISLQEVRHEISMRTRLFAEDSNQEKLSNIPNTFAFDGLED